MIAKISQSKRLKRISVSAATVVLGIGLGLSMTSFDDPGSGEGGDGGSNNHMAVIAQCVFTCTVEIGPWEVTWDQDGSQTECHYSPNSSCTATACFPTSGVCEIGG